MRVTKPEMTYENADISRFRFIFFCEAGMMVEIT